MKIGELYDKYVELGIPVTNRSEEDWMKAHELFRENVKVNILSASDKLAVVRAMNQGCIKRMGDSEKEYIDLSIQKIVMTIGIIARMTDLELDGVDENGSSGSVVNYDKIHLMGLMGYLNIYYGEEIAEFDDFINNENEAIRAFMKAGQPVLINEGKKDKKEEGNEPV